MSLLHLLYLISYWSESLENYKSSNLWVAMLLVCIVATMLYLLLDRLYWVMQGIRFKITGNFRAGEVFRVLHALWGPADVNFCPKLWIMISFHGKKSISNLALFSVLKIHANWWLKWQFLCPRNVWILYSKHDLDALGYCNLIFSNSVKKRNYWRWF